MARVHEVGSEEIKTAGWVRGVETQRGFKLTMRYLVNRQGVLVNETDAMCEAFRQHVGRLFGTSEELTHRDCLQTLIQVYHDSKRWMRGEFKGLRRSNRH